MSQSRQVEANALSNCSLDPLNRLNWVFRLSLRRIGSFLVSSTALAISCCSEFRFECVEGQTIEERVGKKVAIELNLKL